MLKRVQKRIQRKEKEAALGLDEETKEILGFNDTDSDESDSSNFDSDEDDAVATTAEDNSEDDGNEPLDVPDVWEQGSSASDDEEDEAATITVQEALKDPIYVSSIGAGEWQCVVCPGKVLKGSKMVDVHRDAKAHKRRFTHFTQLSDSAAPSASASTLLRSKPVVGQVNNPEGKSNRALKRDKSKLLRKERRSKRKDKAKALKENTIGNSASPAKSEKQKRRAKQDINKSLATSPPSKTPPATTDLADVPSTEAPDKLMKRKRKSVPSTTESKAVAAEDMELHSQPKKKQKRGSALIAKYLARKSGDK